MSLLVMTERLMEVLPLQTLSHDERVANAELICSFLQRAYDIGRSEEKEWIELKQQKLNKAINIILKERGKNE